MGIEIIHYVRFKALVKSPKVCVSKLSAMDILLPCIRGCVVDYLHITFYTCVYSGHRNCSLILNCRLSLNNFLVVLYIPVGVLIDSLSKEINLLINVFFVRLSTMTIYGARRAWNWEDAELPFPFPRPVDYYRIWSGRGRCHVTAGLCFVGCG